MPRKVENADNIWGAGDATTKTARKGGDEEWRVWHEMLKRELERQLFSFENGHNLAAMLSGLNQCQSHLAKELKRREEKRREEKRREGRDQRLLANATT